MLAPRVRRILPVLIAAAIATGLVFPIAFSNFAPYDDEGTHLYNTLLATHGSVYAHSAIEYGPMYYSILAVLFNGLRVSVTHDAGRFVTLGFWGLSAALGGLIVLRLTGHRVAAIIAVAFGLWALWTLTSEPLQPGVLIEPLTAVLLLVMSGPRFGRRQALLAGVIVASIAFSKINIGGYAALALLGWGLIQESRTRRGFLLIAAALLVVPLIVMLPLEAHHWVRDFTVNVVICAGVAGCFIKRRFTDATLGSIPWMSAIVGGLIGSAVAIASGMVRGETLKGMLDATLLLPLDQARGLVTLLPGSANDLRVTAAVLVVAVPTVILLTRVRHLAGAEPAAERWALRTQDKVIDALLWLTGSSLARLAVGLEVALVALRIGVAYWAIEGWGLGLGDSIPALVCSVLVLTVPSSGLSSRLRRGRAVLALLTIGLVIQVYPTAGSQMGFASFFIVLCGVVVLDDAALAVWRGVLVLGRNYQIRAQDSFGPRGESTSATGGSVRTGFRSALAVVGGVLVIASFWTNTLVTDWSTYLSRSSLPLRGSQFIRLDSVTTTSLVDTTRTIDQDCSKLVTMPSMASFYFWTNLRPPRGFILPDGGLWLLPSYQRQVAPVLASTRDLCVLRNPGVTADFRSGNSYPLRGPLVRVLGTDFRLKATIGEFEIYRTKNSYES
jgi:hypothetical protein